jgi:hypothetical protein
MNKQSAEAVVFYQSCAHVFARIFVRPLIGTWVFRFSRIECVHANIRNRHHRALLPAQEVYRSSLGTMEA